MIIGVLKEPLPETRVSILPEHVAILKKMNADVLIENNAGENAFAADEKYVESGAGIGSRNQVLKQSDVILSIHLPAETEIDLLQSKVILGFYQPLYHPELIKKFIEKKVTVFSIDMIPRTTRAQSLPLQSRLYLQEVLCEAILFSDSIRIVFYHSIHE